MIGLNKKHIQKDELQQAVNDLLEAELTVFLGYDPYARAGWNTGNSRNGAYFRKVDTQFGRLKFRCLGIATACFISTRSLTTSSTPMS